MPNVQIRFIGSADFKQVFAQTQMLNEQMRIMQQHAAKFNPGGLANSLRKPFAQAVEQGRQFTAVEYEGLTAAQQYTQALVKQELSVKKLWKARGAYNDVLKEQLLLEKSVAMQWQNNARGVKGDLFIPTQLPMRMNQMADSLKLNLKELVANSKAMQLFSRETGTSAESAARFAAAQEVMKMRLALGTAQLRSASDMMVKWGKNTQWAGRQLMVGLTVPLAAFGAAAGITSYKIQEQLTRIIKVYDLTAKELQNKEASIAKIREDSMKNATEVTKQYGAAVTDTLKVEAELAATGLTGANLFAATNEAMRVATLGELDYNDAIKTTIALQTAFKLSNKQLTDAFNFANELANVTSLSLKDFVAAAPRAASILATLGVNIKQMGVLLAMMKQNGVEAAQGANAIKSAASRLINPTKDASDYMAQFGVNLNQVAKDANDNVFVIFDKIAQSLKNLSKHQQHVALVKLFGTYQLSRISAIMDGFVNRTGQVQRAFKAMNESNTENAKKAADQIGQIMNSAPKQFQKQLHLLQIELAKVGDSFIKMATIILKGLTFMTHAFNQMPDWAKKGALFTAFVIAITGGVIMLTGLIGNLIGNFAKFAAIIGGLLVKQKVLTAEEKASQMMSDLSSKAWYNEADAARATAFAIDKLTTALKEMVLAQEKAQQASVKAAQDGLAAEQKVLDERIRLLALQGEKEAALGRRFAEDALFGYGASGKQINYNRDPLTGQYAKAPENVPAARSPHELGNEPGHYQPALPFYGTQPANAIPSDLDQRLKNMKAAEESSAKVKRNILATAKGMAGFAVGASLLASMAGSSNRIVNDVAQVGLALALFGPALMKPLGIAAKFIAARILGPLLLTIPKIGLMWTAMVADMRVLGPAMKTMLASFLGVRGIATRFKEIQVAMDTMRKGGVERGIMPFAKSVGAFSLSIARFAGVGGLLVGGLVTLIKMRNTMKDMAAEQEKIANSAQDWADILKFTFQETPKHPIAALPEERTTIQDTTNAEKFAEKNKEAVQYIREAKNQQEQLNAAINEGIKAFLHGASPKQAMDAIRNALLAATNDPDLVRGLMVKVQAQIDFTDQTKFVIQAAHQMAAVFRRAWNNELKSHGFWEGLTTGADKFFGTSFLSPKARSSVEQTGKEMWTLFANSGKQARYQIMQQQIRDMEAQGNAVFQSLLTNPKDAALLKKYGINSAKDYWDAWKVYDKSAGTKGPLARLEKENEGLTQKIVKAFAPLDEAQQRQVQAFAQAAGFTEDEVKNLKTVWDLVKLINSHNMEAPGGIGAAKKEWLDWVGRASMATNGLTKAQIAAANEALRLKYGISKAAWAAAGLGVSMDGATVATNKNTKANKENAISQKEMRTSVENSVKSIFENSQQDMVSQADNLWSTWTQAQEDAVDKAANKEVDQLDKIERRFENTTKRITARSENQQKAVEKLYDKRIEAVNKQIAAEQKAEDKRQAMYEAEKTRIQRLADLANKNIDFNVALNTGQLDEAAKIYNDIQATQAGNATQDAQDADQKASDARQAKLKARVDELEREKKAKIDAIKAVEKAQLKAAKAKERADLEAFRREHDLKKKSIDAMKDEIQKKADLQKKFLEQKYESAKTEIDNEIKVVTAKVPSTRKAYNAQIAAIEKIYDEHGLHLQQQGAKWTQFIANDLTTNINAAVRSLKSDVNWEQSANIIANKFTKGTFGINLSQFIKWITTGKLPKNMHAPTAKELRSAGVAPGYHYQGKQGPIIGSFHTGGIVGLDQGGRAGIAKSMSKTPSEHDVRLHVGEGVLNTKAMGIVGTDFVRNANKGNLPNIPAQRGTGGGLTAPSVSGATPPPYGGMTFNDVKSYAVGGYTKNYGGKSTNKAWSWSNVGDKIKNVGGAVANYVRNYHGGAESTTNKSMSYGGSEVNYGGMAKYYGGKGVGGAGNLGPLGLAGLSGMLMVGMLKGIMQMALLGAGMKQLAKNYSGSFTTPAKPGTYGGYRLDRNQLQNAATIIGVGRKMGASKRDEIVAIMTAMQESNLRNVHYGDADSLGLFQQRPSQGWGTPDQIMNPTYAATQFYKHLFGIKNRNSMELYEEAQAVQRSAFPLAYARWEDLARAVVSGTLVQSTQVPGTTSKGWGDPVNPIRVNRPWLKHPVPRGVDLGGRTGQPIYAVNDGKVVTSTDLHGTNPYDNDGYRSYGRYIVINHGRYQTLYAHMNQRLAQRGAEVRKGQIIGQLGSTGNSSGPHLHFQLGDGGFSGAHNINPHGLVPGLAKGGFVLNDGLAQIHQGETVVTKPLTEKFAEGVNNFAESGKNEYNEVNNYHFHFDGAVFNKDVDVERAIRKVMNEMESKKGRSRKID